MYSTAGTGPLDITDYSPGVCNIGPAEIARRRMSGHLALLISAVVLAVLIALGTPHWTRLILVLTAGGSASGYLQAWFHFCAGFGSRGVYNFGEVGTVHAVVDADARARDRARSLRIGLGALAIGVGVAIVAVLLPI
jgi:hypothetical protein